MLMRVATLCYEFVERADSIFFLIEIFFYQKIKICAQSILLYLHSKFITKIYENQIIFMIK
jgi:hypothetical protein